MLSFHPSVLIPPPCSRPVPGFEPGSFFNGTSDGDTWVRTPNEIADKVSRSGNFKAGAAPVLFTRYLGRTSNAVSWLNTFPYDTNLLSQPDIFVLTELVRASNGTVLWADTQSVRGMSTDVESTLLSVPVDVYATLGESVYIRLRPVPTMDIEYQLSGGYVFYEGGSSGAFQKVVRQWDAEPRPGRGGNASDGGGSHGRAGAERSFDCGDTK